MHIAEPCSATSSTQPPLPQDRRDADVTLMEESQHRVAERTADRGTQKAMQREVVDKAGEAEGEEVPSYGSRPLLCAHFIVVAVATPVLWDHELYSLTQTMSCAA